VGVDVSQWFGRYKGGWRLGPKSDMCSELSPVKTEVNCLFSISVLLAGSLYTRPSSAIRGATPLLSHLLLLTKLQKHFGCLLRSVVIMLSA